MNLKQMEVFVAVAESGSFSKGGEATFITQSTVSQHISALEKEFGIRLLDRTVKGALLTEGGKVLLQHARRLLNDAHEVELAINRFKGLEDTALTVGCSNIPGDYMIPEALPAFLERYPGLKLTLVQGDSREILERIGREELEVGIIGSRFEDEGFFFTPLGKDEIRLIVKRGHRWCDLRSVSLDRLTEEAFILREPGSGTGKTVSEALAGAGFNPGELKVKACLGSNEAVKQAVASGLGIAFLSEMSVRREVARGELAEVAVDGVRISRHFYLVNRAGRELSPPAAAFAQVMLETYK